MSISALNVVPGPARSPDTNMRRYQRWVALNLLPAATDWRAERGAFAAALILFELHDRGGVRSRDTLRRLFDLLTTGDAPLVDALLADAEEGHPVLILTHWGTEDGGSVASFVFRLTADLDDPIMAPGDEWEPLTEGVLSLAPLFDKLLDSTVLRFRKAVH